MNYRWIGAIMIIVGSSGFGFLMAANYRREERTYRELIYALEHLINELQYHLTPLPQLCRNTALKTKGVIRQLFYKLAEELENQLLPDASCCMIAAINQLPELSPGIGRLCRSLGKSLGLYDLPGQIAGITSVLEECKEQFCRFQDNDHLRLKNYRTLGLCAGVALAIILI